MNPAQLDIAPGTPADLGVIAELIRDLAEYERLAGEVVFEMDDLRESLFGEHPAAETLVARWDGEPVGFALHFGTFSTFVGRPGRWLEDLYVKPDYRGRGVGLALLARLAAIASERGCARLEWAVLDWNESAVGFYRRLGANPLGDWTTFRLTGEPLAELGRRSR